MSQTPTTDSNLSSAAPGVTLPQQPSGVQYLLVALAGREYGVRLDTLLEVRRFNAEAVAPVPNTPEWLEGIVSLRGNIISVVNLRVFLGYERFEAQPGASLVFDLGFRLGGPTPRLLVVYNGDLQVSLLVDDILGVIFVNPEAVVPAQDQPDMVAPFLEGSYTDQTSAKTVALLDARKLITSPQLLQFEPPN